MGWPLNELIDDVFLPYFYKHGEDGLSFLLNSGVSKMAFLSAYKKLKPIPNEQKKELLEYCLDKWPDKDPLEIEDCIKIVYTIGTLS